MLFASILELTHTVCASGMCLCERMGQEKRWIYRVKVRTRPKKSQRVEKNTVISEDVPGEAGQGSLCFPQILKDIKALEKPL